jgi:serine/threonine protein kinase
MLTGRHYFDYSKMSRFEIDEFIVHGVPAPPSRFLSTIPPDLDAVIMRLLEKDPAARFPDAAAVSQALGKFAARDESRVGAAFLPVLTAISTAALRERKRTRFRVRLEATNEGDTEANNWCGLTLHFPTLSDKDRIAANDIHAWGSADLFIRFPGDLIWGFGHHGKWGEIPAKHLMIEFAVQQWSPGEHFHLEAALLLEASEIQVHARAWGSLKKPDESVIQSNDPGWSNADTKDQQGFPCNVLVIGLKH